MENLLRLVSEWSSIIVLLVQGLFLWGAWSLRKEFMSIQRCEEKRADCARRWDALDDEQNRLDMADAALSARLEALPPGEELRSLHVEMARMGGKIEALQEQIRGQQEVLNIVKRQCERMNSFLLEHGTKS